MKLVPILFALSVAPIPAATALPSMITMVSTMLLVMVFSIVVKIVISVIVAHPISLGSVVVAHRCIIVGTARNMANFDGVFTAWCIIASK